MAENQILILDQMVKIKDREETVPAVTAVVEGNFKKIMDFIIANNKDYTKYNEVVSQALFLGIDQILKDMGLEQPK